MVEVEAVCLGVVVVVVDPVGLEVVVEVAVGINNSTLYEM